MKAIAYNINPKEKEWLVLANYKKHDITFISNSLNEETLSFVEGKEALLIFNEDVLSEKIILGLKELGIKYISTTSANISHIDVDVATAAGLKIVKVLADEEKTTSFSSMQKVIQSLDQWAVGKCDGKNCFNTKNCVASKNLNNH